MTESTHEHVGRISLRPSLTRATLRAALLALATAVVLAGMPGIASAAPTLDQSFTSPSNLSGLINECCAYIGQTFTAGRTGVLSGVNIDVTAFRTSLPLNVAIRAVDSSGLPSSTVLGDAGLESSTSPLTRLITFPQDIPVAAGTQYAIVVNYDRAPPEGPGNALGTWYGASGDGYPRGHEVYSFDYGVTWSSYSSEGFDLHFQTYVDDVPTSTEQCKKGGWHDFTQFTNQGDCVDLINRHVVRYQPQGSPLHPGSLPRAQLRSMEMDGMFKPHPRHRGYRACLQGC
jgi:hypothetical protein